MSILGNKLEWCVEFNGRLVGQTRLSVNASFKRYFCKYDFIMLMGELLQEGVIHFLCARHVHQLDGESPLWALGYANH